LASASYPPTRLNPTWPQRGNGRSNWSSPSGQAFNQQDRETLLHHPLSLSKQYEDIFLKKQPTWPRNCAYFHKKTDGSWEANSPDDAYLAKEMTPFLDDYCAVHN
jgi:hypothetical protein